MVHYRTYVVYVAYIKRHRNFFQLFILPVSLCTGDYAEKAPLAIARNSIGIAKISPDGGQSTWVLLVGGLNQELSYDDVEIFKVEENAYIRGDHLKFPGGKRYV